MKDIIILGMGYTRVDCPFDGEVWGVNNGYRQVKKEKGHIDKLFICHRDQEYDWEGDPVFDFDEVNGLVDEGIEIVTLFKVKGIKKYTLIPFRSLVKKFNTEYFSDTIAYMLAYALYFNTTKNKKTGALKLKEPMKIRMYGVDMHTRDEYATERGGIEFFIGMAKAIGVEVWITPESSVRKTDTGKPYGFYKLNKKVVDPNNIMELQKSPEGLLKLQKLGIITSDEYEKMLQALKDMAKAQAEAERIMKDGNA